MEVGRWEPGWDEYPGNRPHSYFARYDQHIRCWIPNYDELIRSCAAATAMEILRIRERGQTVWLLEVGYGTAALSAQLLPWIDMLNDPYQKLGKPIPVRLYDTIDRAPDMTEIAKNGLGANSLVQLYNVAWQTFREASPYFAIPVTVGAKSCVADGCDTPGGVHDLPVTTVFAVVRDCGGRGSGRRGWCPDAVRRRSVR